MISRDPDRYLSHPFPVGLLPEPAQTFVRKASQALNTAPAFVALPLLAVLGAAIGTTRSIRLKRTWIEFPIIWTAIVGDSGTGKSPAMRLVLQVVHRLQAESMARYRDAQAAHQAAVLAYEVELKQWKATGAGDGSEPPQEPAAPVAERMVTSDITTEALAALLATQPRGLLVAVDELAGWVRSFDAYKGGRGGDAARWLSLWQAEAITVDRKSHEPIHVPLPAVSVCGGIQPGVLSELLGREHFENGLAARLLLAQPERRPGTWSEEELEDGVSEAMADVISTLYSMGHARVDGPVPEPVELTLSIKARRVWIDAYNRRAEQLAGLSGDHAAAAAKMPAYVARLALIFHLVRVVAGDESVEDPRQVDHQDVVCADQLCEWFGREASRIYCNMGDRVEQREAHDLIDLVKRKDGKLTAGELKRSRPGRYGSAKEAAEELRGLAELGFGRVEDRQPGSSGGRPSTVFVLSPEYGGADAVWEAWTATTETASTANTPSHAA